LSSRLSKSVLLLPLLFLFTSLTVHAVDPVKSLPPHYRHWIEEEVPYIIQTEERKEFLALKTDAERDNFIKVFWDARNPDPDPGSEINEFKQEHYRRSPTSTRPTATSRPRTDGALTWGISISS